MLFIPQKNRDIHEESLDNGDLILVYQAMYRPLFLRIKSIFNPKGGNTFTKKLQLDQLGVQVWRMIDGKQSVKSIIEQFAGHHKLDSREAEVSVTLFLKSLGEKGLIGMKEP